MRWGRLINLNIWHRTSTNLILCLPFLSHLSLLFSLWTYFKKDVHRETYECSQQRHPQQPWTGSNPNVWHRGRVFYKWHILTTEYYVEIQSNKALHCLQVVAWLTLENMTLCERSPQKTTYCAILFIWDAGIGKCMETESRFVVARGWGERVWIFFWSGGSDENFLKLNSCTTLDILKPTKVNTLNG